jgi:hypothetical protein
MKHKSVSEVLKERIIHHYIEGRKEKRNRTIKWRERKIKKRNNQNFAGREGRPSEFISLAEHQRQLIFRSSFGYQGHPSPAEHI